MAMIDCPHCRQRVDVDPATFGLDLACPFCQGIFVADSSKPNHLSVRGTPHLFGIGFGFFGTLLLGGAATIVFLALRSNPENPVAPLPIAVDPPKPVNLPAFVPLAVNHWVDARTQTATIDDVSVRITEVKIGSTILRDFRGDFPSVGKFLVVKLSIKNSSETKKLVHSGWSGNDLIGRDAALMRDNFGNLHRRQSFGLIFQVKDQLKNDSIFPGKAVDEVLVFDLPIEKMEKLRLELPARAYGGEGIFLFEIPREMILKEPS